MVLPAGSPRAPPGVETPTPKATLREHGVPERPFIVGTRRVPHVRHHRKYAAAPLPHHRWFHFRGPDGSVTATAPDIGTFNRLLQALTPASSPSTTSAVTSRAGSPAYSGIATSQRRPAREREVLTRRAAEILHARERLDDAIDARYRDVAD